MEAKKQPAATPYPAIVIITFFLLVGAGVWSIVQANAMYNQSFQQSDAMVQKFFDTSFKKAMTLPLAAPNYAVVKDGYAQALLYFTLALGAVLLVLVLPRLQNFTLSPTGGITLTLRDLQQTVDTLLKQNNTLEEKAAGEGGKPMAATRGGARAPVAAALVADDPQKGRWGRAAENNDRKLTATVSDSSIPGYYQVVLTVESTDEKKPLKGLVKFHLHPNFQNPEPVIAVLHGKAVLKLTKVQGPFTVGAEADNETTRLELDLAELPGAPKAFREP